MGQYPSVAIRIWAGNVVCYVVSITPTGFASDGPAGGAECSIRPDIELDPWRGLIVDHRQEHPYPQIIGQDDPR